MVAMNGSGGRADGEEEPAPKEPATEVPRGGDGEPGGGGGGRGGENRDVESPVAASEDLSPGGIATEARVWKWSVVYLCFFGFMASIKPGEPFISPYLLSEEKNFTTQQVTNEITPVLSYSYMAVQVPVFLLTDYLRYKPVLVLQGLSQVSVWLLLLLGTTLLQMQFMEFFYGITMAARVAYSSYIFSLVEPGLYQRVASYSRTSILLGMFTSSVLGQLCISLGNIYYSTLAAVSLGFMVFGLLLSLCLPWPKRSMFFNRQVDRGHGSETELDKMNPAEGSPSPPAPPFQPAQAALFWTCAWKDSVLFQMLQEVTNVVRRPNLRLWCLWWVFNSTGYYLVLYQVHILWNKVNPATENKHVYNGGVEAVSTLLGAITSFIAGFVKVRWSVWSELVICIVTALQACLLLLMGNTDNIWACYVAYALFKGFYQFLVPIAIFQIASSLTKELCALVFGINTFLGTVLKTIITLIVVDKRGLGLPVQPQFLVYFFYFTLLTVVYMVAAAVVITRHCRNPSGGGAGEEATPTELSPVALDSKAADAVS